MAAHSSLAKFSLNVSRYRMPTITLDVGSYDRGDRYTIVTIDEFMSILAKDESPSEGYYYMRSSSKIGEDQSYLISSVIETLAKNTWLNTVHLTIFDPLLDFNYLLESLTDKLNISELTLMVNTNSDYRDTMVNVFRTLNLTSLTIAKIAPFDALTQVLLDHSKLKVINFSQIGIPIEARLPFINAMMTKVSIFNFILELADAELTDISTRLMLDSKVEILSIVVSPTTDMSALGRALSSVPKHVGLKSLKILSGSQSGRYGPIFQGLRNNKYVLKLEIDSVGINDIPELIEMLKHNTMLEILKIKFQRTQFNQISSALAEHLLQALKNSSLLGLTVYGDGEILSSAVETVALNRHNFEQKDASLIRLLL